MTDAKHEAPAEGAFSAGQVWKDPHTDRWIADVEERGSAVVAAQAIGEDEDQAEARRDLILAALTRRHEAPVSVWDAIRSHPCYGEHQPGCDCVIPAQTETEVPPFLKRMTDAKYEAPAEGAGEFARQMEILRKAASFPVPDDDSDFTVEKARRGSESWRVIAANVLREYDRARSSAPEAREEALGNLLAVIHGDGGHRALEVGTKQAALEAEKIVAGLFAAPSADKLRAGLDEIERLVNQSGAIPKGELRSILAALKGGA